MDERAAQEDGRKWISDYADTAVSHYRFDEPEHFKAAKGYAAYAQMACSGSGRRSGSAAVTDQN